jgi:Spy/CpxP family protein refolding chaperone
MKHIMSGTVVTLGLLLVINMVIPAQGGMVSQRPMGQSEGAAESSPRGMMGEGGMGMMGPQTMGGMMGGGRQGMPEGMGMFRPGQLVRMLKPELGLSDEQVKQLTQIFSQATKLRIKQRADLRIAEFELGELLEAEPVDMGQVESKLKAIEGLRTTLRFTLIKAHEQAKGILTPDQRQKLERMHDRLAGMMGPGMMRMMEMMGEGGSGSMGMMGPQMMQQMLRAMMGGQRGETAGESHPQGR